MAYSGVQMLMEKLKQLITYDHVPIINHPLIIRERPQFQLLYDVLDNPLFKTLFINHHQELEKVTDLRKRFEDATHEAEYVVDLFLSGVLIKDNKDLPTSLNLDDVMRCFNSVKLELTTVDSSHIKESQSAPAAAASSSFSRNSGGTKDEVIVGLDGDVELIRDKLVEDLKKVDVVSIVGMGGIGKTTLATKVFNDDYVKYHFHVRVWVTVSQTYNKRNVLTQILESICGQLDLQNDNSDSRLREMVHKKLMGKRYLIVIDDIWHVETWDDLKVFFPHDNNGSRILLTSRLTEVAKHANSGGLVHHVGYLNKERSWELLCRKVFHGDDYPEWSYDLGMQIVENCKGLPLAVAVIAGVLAKEALSERFWVEITEVMSSYIVGDQNGCLETLGLSYNHLPLHLRECFLYFGGFPEDYEFKVRTLIWFWVAEGFIEQDGIRSLEDIAKGYLIDLIDRNLLIITVRSSSSGVVKACKVHDLVRELCLKKGNEEGFFSKISNDITTPPYKPARVIGEIDFHFQDFPHPSFKNLRTFLWFSRRGVDARYFSPFMLLRVLYLLNLPNYRLIGLIERIELLVHLRYLGIYIIAEEFPSSICKLWNLQTLILIKPYDTFITLPSNISDLVNLRHLRIHGRHGLLPFIERPMKLQTIIGVSLGDGLHPLQKCFPYLKELTCETLEYDFKSLTCLEKLKSNGPVKNDTTFPATLKTLTLSWCQLQWSDISIIQSLPNLQVLKLGMLSFIGSCWNTYGQEFPQLKLLRLDYLDIQEWEAYGTSFSCLRQLEIIQCFILKEIPHEIGEIPTLELIKIRRCMSSVGESARRIQQEQHDLGNYHLKIDVSGDLHF